MTEFRTYDGSGNNEDNPEWGKSHEPLVRVTKVAYADGISSPAKRRPTPREISNFVCVEDATKPQHATLSSFMWAWGQFVDHEIDLTTANGDDLSFKAPAGDPDAPRAVIPFSRADHDPRTGDSRSNPRQQVNVLAAYIDASNVYGASCERAHALRALDGTGRMKTTRSPHGELLPFNKVGLDNDRGPLRGGMGSNDPPAKFFLAGDIRCNEHNVLTCLHTLFAREHNRICDDLAARGARGLQRDINTFGRDEAIYQRARRIVGAIEQVITYEEFLPALLGPGAISGGSYNKNSNASIRNVFSTVAYRLGHSMLNADLKLIPPGCRSGRTLRLERAYWKPEQISRWGIEVFLNGLAQQNMRKMDTQAVRAIRTLLFNVHDPSAPKHKMLMDLAALNIQRGRDHGLPGYNQCRADYTLKRKKTFEEISSDPETVRRLKAAYKSVDDIDPWVGGLAEDPHKKAIVGEFFFAVLKDQFTRLRAGDRFWYEYDPAFTPRDRKRLKRTRLSDVIKRNTGITQIQNNVFLT